MISILIPTYNYNAFPLVSILHEQLEDEKVDYEIICLDDGSQNFHFENQSINSLRNCSYSILDKNIGRSSIRNLLAKKAKFEHLLFLDADVIPVHENFISNYLSEIDNEEKAVYGGVRYQEQKPSSTLLLRWIYGKSREALSAEKRKENPYLSFLTNSFLIKKNLFEQFQFNENLKNWGHEDTLFSYNLQENKIKISHIDNPVVHEGLEDYDIFLNKTRGAINGLADLIEKGLIDPNYIKLSKVYFTLKKFRLQSAYILFYKLAKPAFLKNLKSNNPSLLIFDLYRLGFLCILKSN